MEISPLSLLRISCGLLASAFLFAAYAAYLRSPRPESARGARPHLLAFLPFLLLAALSLALAFAPIYTPSQGMDLIPAAEAVLLVTSAAILSTCLLTRRQPEGKGTDPADAAAVDALTRIASHRAFQDRLAHECDRAYRFGESFVLLVLDLDDFHQLNNRHGHRAGDHVLSDLARLVRAQLREIDLVARFGGDQFAIILPHAYEKGGADVAERLRQTLAGSVFRAGNGPDLHLTASLGVCVYPADGVSPPELVEAARKALDLAKALGGNQVQMFRDTQRVGAPGTVFPLPRAGRGAVVRSLAAAVDVRDGYTHEHSRSVSELSAALARHIGLPSQEVARIAVGALLHDVGKIGIPDAILTKEGSLSEEEWECVRRHPVLGKRIIEQASELTDVMPLVLHHQERYDGTGYPGHLRGESIPLGARIIAVADAYHAIRSNRPYRSGRTHRDTMCELERCSGTQFDPQVVAALVCILTDDEKLQALPSASTKRAGAPMSAPTSTRAPAPTSAPAPAPAALTSPRPRS